MNTRCQNSVLLLLVGLLLIPHSLMALSGSPIAVCPLKKQSDAKQEGASDDPISVSRFGHEPTSVFLPPPRDFIRPLIRAIRIYDEGDHVHAAELIGQFLMDMGEEDFLIFNDKVKGTAVSISSIANDMLSKFSDSAREAYRVRFGVPAKQRLNLAIAEANYFEIAQVKQRFLHTDAGLEAAMLLGHHHFDAGRVLLAADSFQTSLDLLKQQGKSDSKLSVLTAVSWVLARRPKLAESVMRDLAKTNDGKFRLGDQDVVIDDDQPLAAIEAFVEAGPLDSSSAVDQWLLVGGNARRNVTTVNGFPVGLPLWEVGIDVSQAKLREIKGVREKNVDLDSRSLVPASVPLIVDGLVLFGNENKIQAVDFNTGKRVWAVQAGESFVASSNNQAGFENQFFQGKQQFGRVNVQSAFSFDNTPWSGFLRGHASSDGKFIFRIVKSAAGSTDPIDHRNIRFGRNNYSETIVPTNRLQAIDMLREGELAWEVGAGKVAGDPRLTQISFLGAPLPIDGVLYAIGKRLEEVVLVALNSTDGNLLWIQSLASDDGLKVSRHTRLPEARPNYSLRPSYSDGILVCPTGKNAMVAIDTVGRRLLWGMQTTVGKPPGLKNPSELVSVQNPQVHIENSRIVAFDVGNDTRLLVMDLLDGSPLVKTIGKAGVQCRDVLHVASVDERQVVLVEKKRVRAISSNNGRQLWQTSIADFGPPTGVGYVAQTNQGGEMKRALYLPTEGNTIIKIDLGKKDAGKNNVVDGIRAERPFGNLIVHQGRVISRSETSVACFELDSKVVTELKNAIDKTGGIEQLSPRLKIKQAALLRNQGKSKQAIELMKTIDASDRSDRFKIEFLQNITLMFNSDPDFAVELAKEHGSWFEFETNPRLYLEYVELLVKKNRVDDVLEQIFQSDSFFVPANSSEEAPLLQRPITGYNLPKQKEPAEEVGGVGVGEGEEQNGQFDPEKGANPFDDDTSSFLESQKNFSKSKISFAPNHWAKTQLIRMVRNYPESKIKIQAAIEQRLKETKISNVIKRHRMFRQFPLELIAPKLRFELAEQLVAREHVAEAENMLASLLGFLPTAAKQIQTVDADLSKDALVVLWQSIRDAQYGAKAGVAMADGNEQTHLLQGFNRVDVSAVQVPRLGRWSYPEHVEQRGELINQLFKNKKLVIWGGTQEIEFFDANGQSEERFALFENSPNNPVDLKNNNGWIQANHSLAVFRQKGLLLTMDLSKLKLGQSSVLWYKNITPQRLRSDSAGELDLYIKKKLPPEDIAASFPTTGCCCYINSDQLVCVDAFTGKTLWSRTKEVKDTLVIGNGSQVATMDSQQARCSVFDIRTGERIKTEVISKHTGSLCSVDGMDLVASSVALESDLEGLEALVDYRPEVESDSKGAAKSITLKGRFLSRYDVEASEFVWKKVFGSEAKVCRIAGDRILVLSADNQIYIFDAKSGKELAKVPSGLTEAERVKIRYVGAMEHAGQDLVVLSTGKARSIKSVGYTVRSLRSQTTFMSGHLLLLSRGNIQPVWPEPAEVTGFHLLPTLPSGSPLLILNRSVQSIGSDSKPVGLPVVPSISFQFFGLDMRTGKVVFNKILGSAIPYNGRGSILPIVDPVAGTIDMGLTGWNFKLHMKKSLDEPPAPVASVTKVNAVARNYSTAKAVLDIVDSKFDIEKINQQLVKQAEEYEAALEQKRAKERALLEAEAQ